MNAMKDLLDVMDNPPIRYGFIVIFSDYAAISFCVKFVD